MKLLFVHQNFPGQFRHIAAHFAADPANRVVAIGEAPNLKKATAIHPRIEQRPYASPQPASAGMRAPPEMCTQCQTRVPSPIWAPSSTMAVG